MEDLFREQVGRSIEPLADVHYAFQSLESLPPGIPCPENRTKPWGTAHAVLSAADHIQEPFGVINADDFYGLDSFRTLGQFLSDPARQSAPMDFALVGFVLKNTLSPFGSVSRGICELDNQGNLASITEAIGITSSDEGIRYPDVNGSSTVLTGNEIVSMNTWGFTPAMMPILERHFADFLTAYGNDPKAEFFLPMVLDRLISEGQASVRILPTDSQWFGVTYRDDKPHVQQCLARLIETGVYPAHLWSQPPAKS
jgi:hypothetical protein